MLQSIFDARFARGDDPWEYNSQPYEQRKRLHLATSIPQQAAIIVELGCANGHNLDLIARMNPNSMVIGSDVSRRAVSAAKRQTHQHANVKVIWTGDERGVEELRRLTPRIDVLVLAEVLYYLGGDRSMSSILQPLAPRLAPNCAVIMIHCASDGTSLHDRASNHLDVAIANSRRVGDPIRPYVIAVAAHSPDTKGLADSTGRGRTFIDV